MALFNLSVFLVLACVTAFGEPTLREGNNATVLFVVNSETKAWCGKSEQQLEKRWMSNYTKIVKQVSGPRSKDDDISQLYETVKEQIASIQVIPQTANAQLQSGGDVPSSHVSSSSDLFIGYKPNVKQYKILSSESVYPANVGQK